MRLEGKRALITGGLGGIGRKVAQRFAAEGAELALADAASGESPVADARCYTADLSRVSECRRLAAAVEADLGPIDLLVNCVGTHIEKPAEELSAEEWDQVHDTNLRGAFLLSQAAGRQMIAQRGGRQIHISSVRSLLGINRGFAAYTSSKAGMNLLVKQLATEWAEYGITVNGIAPTFIRTELVRHYLEDEDFYNALVGRIPLTRVGEPFDIVGATVFFASPAADFITGQILFIDGGVTATQ